MTFFKRQGAWLRSPVDIVGRQTITKVLSGFNLEQIQAALSIALQSEKVEILEQCMSNLKQHSVIGINHALQPFLASVNKYSRVNDYTSSFHYSRLHLQRVFKK